MLTRVWFGACLYILAVADIAMMISIQTLWDRFRIAQGEPNTDAALCFRHAIEAYNRCDYQSVLFWYQQAEMCESVEA